MSARVPYRLPVLPPELEAEPGFRPKESFSPSQLVRYGGPEGCKRQWAWGALFGVWSLKKSIAALLGSLIHGSLEHYLRGGNVFDLNGPNGEIRLDKKTWKEFETQLNRGFITREKLAELAAEAPKRAIAGLHLLPNTKDPAIEAVQVERWLEIDTTRVIGGVERIKIPGKVDLSIRRAGVWYLFDHKSTKGAYVPGAGYDPWYYAKTPEQLMKDPQAVFYALDMMLRHNLDSLWIRWVYYLTDLKSHPIAKPVDVEFKREDVLREAYAWLVIANEMRGWVRGALAGLVYPEDLPANKEACPAFGGCSYHFSKGGPCSPDGEVKLGDLILTGGRPERAKQEDMSLATMMAATQGAAAAVSATQAPAIPPGHPLVPPEAAAAPAAAPVASLPPLPAGWHYFNGAPRQDAPAGFQWNHDGTGIEVVGAPPAVAPPPAAAPSAPVVPPAAAVPQPPVVPGATQPPVVPGAPPVVVQTTVAPAAGPGSGAALLSPDGPQPETGGKRKGRPKGSTNKPKGEGGEDDDVMERLLFAARGAPVGHPLRELTIAQFDAVREVFESA